MATGEGETQQVVLEARKRTATAAITRRVLALQERITAAKSIVRLGDADRSELTTQLQDQVNGLTIPKARGVVVSDIELSAADRLTMLADRLAAAVDRAKGDTAEPRTD